VDDVVFVFERLETARCRESDLAEDTLRHTITIELIHRTTVHELHTDVDSSFLEKGTVKVDNEGRSATMQDIEFHDDGRKLGVFEFETHLLHGHDETCCVSASSCSLVFYLARCRLVSRQTLADLAHLRLSMTDLVDCAVVSLAQLVNRFHVVERDLKRLTRRELNSFAVENGFALELETAGFLVDVLCISVHLGLLLGWVAIGTTAHGGQGHLRFLSAASGWGSTRKTSRHLETALFGEGRSSAGAHIGRRAKAGRGTGSAAGNTGWQTEVSG
jgi:hypothetical protein